MLRAGIRAGQRLAGFLVAVALLAACSGEGQQASTQLPSASSTSAEPTPVLPPLGPADFPVPDEARVQDEAGAREFLTYYIELLNRQQAVPAGEPIRALGPECQQCLVIAQRFDEAAQSGWRLEGGEIRLMGEPGVTFDGDSAQFSFLARADAASAVTADGQPVPGVSQPAQSRIASALTVAWSAEKLSWLATGLELG